MAEPPHNSKSDTGNKRLQALFILALAIFLAATIRSGHEWGDDFAQYILHAKNIVEHQSYEDTGYVFNPLNPKVGPRAYPPLFPLSIAPVYAVFGLDLVPYKMLMSFFFLAGLCLSLKLFSADLSPTKKWLLLLVVGLNPSFWTLRNSIMSENLFLPIWYLTLYVADSWYRRKRVIGSESIHGLLLGLLMFVTCATRLAGVVLLPTLIVCEALIAKRITRFAILSATTFLGLFVVQRLWIPGLGSGYFQHLTSLPFSFDYFLNQLTVNIRFLLQYWGTGWSSILRKIALLLLLSASAGFFRMNYPKPTFTGVASAAFLGLFVLWHTFESRFILPLFPAYAFYTLQGVDFLNLKPRLKRWAGASFVVFIALNYFHFYATADYSPIADGPESPAAVELFDFLKTKTAPNEVCIIFKPRATALYAQRPASPFPTGADEKQFSEYVESIGATLAIVRNEPRGNIPSTFEDVFVEKKPDSANEIFHNTEFIVFRLSSPEQATATTHRERLGTNAP